MSFLDSVIARACSLRKTIVLAEGEDARVIEAARRAHDNGVASCILLGNGAVIKQQADALGIGLSDIKIEDPGVSQYHERYSQELWELRKHKGMTEERARDTMSSLSPT